MPNILQQYSVNDGKLSRKRSILTFRSREQRQRRFHYFRLY